MFRPPSPDLAAAKRRRPGFTLIELLVVVSVIAVMSALAIPAITALQGGTDFTTSVYNIAGMLDQARAYAVANNTYVLAGIVEESAAVSVAANPQQAGTGRIEMAVVASKSGTRPYQGLLPNNLASWFTSDYGTGSAFLPVTNLLTLQNLHLADLQGANANGSAGATVGSGNMLRPALTSAYYDLSAANSSVTSGYGVSSTQFAWPLGSGLTSPQPQHLFARVIEFDPQGSARIINANNPSSMPDAIPQYLEIGLQPTHGTLLAGPTAGQVAAIQIAGITGAVRIYRP